MRPVLRHLDQYFSGKFRQYGATPRGVDWKNKFAQVIRFKQVMKIVELDVGKRFTLNDLGSGYGAMFDYLRQNGFEKFSYRGYDLSQEMVDEGRRLFGRAANFRIQKINHPRQMMPADFAVASGIFNNKNGFSNSMWQRYILDTIDCMNAASRRGFSFNVLSTYSDKEFRRSDLYYAEPLFFFDYCKRKFSPEVTMSHSYGLHEFTLMVYKRGV